MISCDAKWTQHLCKHGERKTLCYTQYTEYKKCILINHVWVLIVNNNSVFKFWHFTTAQTQNVCKNLVY